MERLTEKIAYDDITEYELKHGIPNIYGIHKLGEYEDLEEQGLLLKLPCAEGTPVYRIVKYLDYGEPGDKAISVYRIEKSTFSLTMLNEFGKTVFLTDLAAEAELARLRLKAHTTFVPSCAEEKDDHGDDAGFENQDE